MRAYCIQAIVFKHLRKWRSTDNNNDVVIRYHKQWSVTGSTRGETRNVIVCGRKGRKGSAARVKWIVAAAD